VMPSSTSRRKVASRARDYYVQDDEALDRIRVSGRKRICGWSSPVVSDKVKRAVSKPLAHEAPNVVCYCLFVIAIERTRTVT